MLRALLLIIIATTAAHADEPARSIGGIGGFGSGTRLSPQGGWGGGYAWLAAELERTIYLGGDLAIESVNGPTRYNAAITTHGLVGIRHDFGPGILAADLGLGFSRQAEIQILASDRLPARTVPSGAIRAWYAIELEANPAVRALFAVGLDARTAIADDSATGGIAIDMAFVFEGR